MCASAARTQDLPPLGGYQKIVYERRPGRVLFKGRHILAAYLGVSLGSMYIYHFHHLAVLRNRLERESGLSAVFPFLLAERDRAFLKRLHYNREEEKELMKDVPNWEVGTYFGEPIYKTIDPELNFIEPIFEEFYSQVETKYWNRRALRRFSC